MGSELIRSPRCFCVFHRGSVPAPAVSQWTDEIGSYLLSINQYGFDQITADLLVDPQHLSCVDEIYVVDAIHRRDSPGRCAIHVCNGP